MQILRTALRPAQFWIWNNRALCARNLLRFAETEAEGGRDLLRAAEITTDPILRRLLVRHASDEQRHAELFRRRGVGLLKTLPASARKGANTGWLTPGERGLDDLDVGAAGEAALLAFVHLSERCAARDFAAYRDLLEADPPTQAVFEEVLRDERHHMTYTLAQLTRIAPRRRGWLLWRARLGRLWKAYLRIASAIAGVMSRIILTALYFVVLPPFAWMAQRAERREPPGWRPVRAQAAQAMRRQY